MMKVKSTQIDQLANIANEMFSFMVKSIDWDNQFIEVEPEILKRFIEKKLLNNSLVVHLLHSNNGLMVEYSWLIAINKVK